jgi:hypothetical protein
MYRNLLLFPLLAICVLVTEGCAKQSSTATTGTSKPRAIPGESKRAAPIRTANFATVPRKSEPSALSPDFTRTSSRRDRDLLRIISSEPDTTFVSFATDLNRVVGSRHLRILPIIGRDIVETLHDLTHLREIDVGVVQSDVINAAAEHKPARRLEYIAKLYNKEFHLLASHQISDIRQLHGRKVNIDRPGTATHLTARIIFEKLGIAPEFTTHDQAAAHQRLRSGEIAAAVYVAARPARDIAAFQADGFHLVAVPYGNEVADGYLPAQFEVSDYPNLMKHGRPVETIAVANVLAVKDGLPGSDRYKRLTRFVDAFFSRFDQFHQAGHDPKWAEGSPSVTVPGWKRFRPAQEWLDKALSRRTRNDPPQDLRWEEASRTRSPSSWQQFNPSFEWIEWQRFVPSP